MVKTSVTKFNSGFDGHLRERLVVVLYQDNIDMFLYSTLGYLASFGLQVTVQLVGVISMSWFCRRLILLLLLFLKISITSIYTSYVMKYSATAECVIDHMHVEIQFFWHGTITAQQGVIDTGMCGGEYVLLLK